MPSPRKPKNPPKFTVSASIKGQVNKLEAKYAVPTNLVLPGNARPRR